MVSFEESSMGCQEGCVFCSICMKCSTDSKSSRSVMSFNVHISISFNREGLSMDKNLQSIEDTSIILLGLLCG